MLNEWNGTTLSHVLGSKGYIRGPFGSALKRGELQATGIPVYEQQHAIYGIRNFRFFIDHQKYRELKRFTVQPNDLIVSCSGTLGRISIIKSDDPIGVISQALLILRPDAYLIDARFLYYFLLSPAGYHALVSVSSGSVQVNLAKRSEIESIKLNLPPLAEQKAIVGILGALDDKIELNRRMNETLEAMARAIFKSWFVDFDPVRAKAEGRMPAGMDAETAALFPDSFVDSALGKIPAGWRVASMSEVIAINPTRRLKQGAVASYLDMSSMPTSSHRAQHWYDRPAGSGARFINGDTLLARITPCLENGKTAFVDFLEDSAVGWGSTEYIVLRPLDLLPAEFAYYLARDEDFRNFAIQNMTGSSGRQRVPNSCFDQYLLVVPRDEIAKCFGDQTSMIMHKIRANSEESRTLFGLRDTMLPKLLSGEVRVKDAERVVAETL